MRVKSLLSLLRDVDPESHVLVRVLGRNMHLSNGLAIEPRYDHREPHVIVDLSSEYTYNPRIEASRS